MTDFRELLRNQSIGPIEVDLNEDDVVTDVVVLLKLQRFSDTDDALGIGATENTGGIVAHGMLTCGVIQSKQWMINGGEDNE